MPLILFCYFTLSVPNHENKKYVWLKMLLLLWRGRCKVRDGVVSKQEFQEHVTLSYQAKHRKLWLWWAEGCVWCPWHCWKISLFRPTLLYSGHAREAGGESRTLRAWIIEIRGNTNSLFNLQHNPLFLEMLSTHGPQTAKRLGMNFFHSLSLIPLCTGKYLRGQKRRCQECG